MELKVTGFIYDLVNTLYWDKYRIFFIGQSYSFNFYSSSLKTERNWKVRPTEHLLSKYKDSKYMSISISAETSFRNW